MLLLGGGSMSMTSGPMLLLVRRSHFCFFIIYRDRQLAVSRVLINRNVKPEADTTATSVNPFGRL